MTNLIDDCRFGLRMLLKRPAFTAVALLTLALGVGVNVTIFSVLDTVLLGTLPYRAPDRLVTIWVDNPRQGLPLDFTSYPRFLDWQAQSRSFEELAVWSGARMVLTGTEGSGGRDPEELRGAAVTGAFFPLLGVQPLLGPGLRRGDEGDGRASLIVLSHGLWTRRFASDPGIVGRAVSLSARSFTVVGVMPPRVQMPSRDLDFWMPLQFGPKESRGNFWLRTIGRLKPGVSVAQALQELKAVQARLGAEHPGDRELGVAFVPLTDHLTGPIRAPLLILFAAVSCLLLIACTNVAGMLMARAAEREREVAIRAALGAGRARVVQQMLIETLMLFAVAGAIGVLLAIGGVALLGRMQPPDLPQIVDAVVDWRVLAFAAATTLATGLTFGLLPALASARVALVDVLKQGGRTGAGSAGGYRVRRLLSALQMALAIGLLASAGLLVRSFQQVQAVDLGFRSDRMLTFGLGLPRTRYPQASQTVAFYDQLLARLRAEPDVEIAGGITTLFLGPFPNSSDFSIDGRGETYPGPLTTDAVTPGFFEAMQIPLVKGRFFDERDRAGAQRVALINAAMARRYFPNADPIGQRIVYGGPSASGDTWMTIVGVVADTRRAGLEREPIVEAWRPFAQAAPRGLTIVARTTGDPLALVPRVRAAVTAIDPAQPLSAVATLDQWLGVQRAARAFQMTLLTAFAATALLLAAVGLYGVIAQLVTRRRGELGVRVALGASRGDVMRLVLRDAAWLILYGTIGGLLLGALAGRSLQSVLYQVGALDPITFVAAPVVLAATALAACLVPVRRAMRVDPVTALRD